MGLEIRQIKERRIMCFCHMLRQVPLPLLPLSIHPHSIQNTLFLFLLLSKLKVSEIFPASHFFGIERKSEKKGKGKRKNPILMKNFLEKERF